MGLTQVHLIKVLQQAHLPVFCWTKNKRAVFELFNANACGALVESEERLVVGF